MLYLVRNMETRALMGLFYAIELEVLWDLIDEQANPYDVEFRSLDTVGGGVWFEEIADEPDDEDDEYMDDYDEENDNYLYNAIPEYLRDDTDNQKYILFVDMVAQQYDNTWLYTKDLTNRFNADNRLDYGISRDLVADAIRDFGIKLYSSNFNTDDLYTAFLGITPSGSSFPFPNMTGSFPTPSGSEYVNTEISESDDIVPLDHVNK